MELDMADLLARGEVRFSYTHDLAVVRIEDCNPTNTSLVKALKGVKFTSPETALDIWPVNGLRKLKELVVGSDVVSVGFPSDIGLEEIPQIDRTMPLLRKGILAGVNQKQGTLILDSPVYGGDSGGPVLLRETDNLTFSTYHIIGIQTQWVPFKETWNNLRFGYVNQNLANSGYSVAEPMDSILEMIWK